MAGAVAVFVIAAFVALWLATDQPWLGLVMRPGDDGLIVVSQVQRQELSGDLEPGSRIVRLDNIALRAVDLIEEPDTLASYDAVNAFRERQATLSDVLLQTEVELVWTRTDDTLHTLRFAPYAGRPAWSLPFEFWLQLVVGGAGAIVGGWVWALRRDRASGFFALSGLGLMLSALSASVYSTRELALATPLMQALNAGNSVGTNIFGLALVSLLLVYPHRIGNGLAIAAVWLIGAIAVGAHLLQMMPSQALGSYGPMLVQFIVILALIVAQLILARRAPLARAALGWFGLSILLGTGGFVFAIALPVLLGLDPQTSQAHAFGIILLIYCGLAVGVARYRLFDLGLWSFRLASYLLGGLILIGLDALLIYGVAIERVPAFGLALLGVAILYLPVRNYLGGRLARQSRVDPARFRDVFDIALSRGQAEQEAKWRTLLQDCFDPLSIDPGPSVPRTQLVDGGQQVLVPATAATQGLAMRFAQGGRRLFSQADVDWLQQLVDLMDHALASRDAHDSGVRQERTRMARDLHDNIGAQLLRTLHSPDKDRKDAIVAETLTDLRDIINNAQGQGMNLSEILSELRFETDDRLGAIGIALNWRSDISELRLVDARLAHTLRSIIREAASNTIRHAEASLLTVTLEEDADNLMLDIADDGIGMPQTRSEREGGLMNMAVRAEGHGGEFRLSGVIGTHIQVRLPLGVAPS
ncbi:MAG: hypothetical protein ABS75_21115 [Pelagibacterium sp. SCN 63-23]|nr:MAG: hypothetical protein ABS75_21115 [Pelagibacterium sp. SCN 63-23]